MGCGSSAPDEGNIQHAALFSKLRKTKEISQMLKEVMLHLLLLKEGVWESISSEQFDAGFGDEEFAQEIEDKTLRTEKAMKNKASKKTGQVEAEGAGDFDGDLEDMFQAVDAGQGDEFMAVKPWLGAIKEPENHPDPNPSAPNVGFELEYVFGYRCEDVRQNLFFNEKNEIVYNVAALGIILDPKEKFQKFFGGGEAEQRHKSKASADCHTDDIVCLSVSTDRKLAATGQVGQQPRIFIWSTDDATAQGKAITLPKGTRGVTAIGFSGDGKYIGAADHHNDHNVYVYEVATSQLVWKDKGGPDKIFDLSWSKKDGHYMFTTVGPKHIYVWDIGSKKKSRGLLAGKAAMTNFSCVDYDVKGRGFTGGQNGKLYVWNGSGFVKTLDAHKGVVHSVRCIENQIFTGGSDKNITIFSDALAKIKSIAMGSTPRAIDCVGTTILAGLRNGDIVQLDQESEEKTIAMRAHSDGEVWGLDLDNKNGYIITSADDNKIMVYSIDKRECVSIGKINEKAGPARKRGASTMSNYPPNQCARAIAINDSTGHIAVGHNNGEVTIRQSVESIDTIIVKKTESKQWIEVMQFSPDFSKLAVGSHDNNIYVYDATSENYKLICKFSSHNSFITCLDWSVDGSYIRSVCGAYELLFFSMDSQSQDKSGASNTVSTEWATMSCKLGWNVQGIFPSGTDGSHINGCDLSKAGEFIVTGDDYGLINIFNNPALEGHKSRGFRGHSEHVVRVRFTDDDEYLISIGGMDKGVFQWRRVDMALAK